MSKLNFTINVHDEDIGLQTLCPRKQNTELLTSRSDTSLELHIIWVAETFMLSCCFFLKHRCSLPSKSQKEVKHKIHPTHCWEKWKSWIKRIHFDLKICKFNVDSAQCLEIFSANLCLIKLLICISLPSLTVYQSFLPWRVLRKNY